MIWDFFKDNEKEEDSNALKGATALTNEINELIANEDATKKDYYDLLADLNRYEKSSVFPGTSRVDLPVQRKKLIDSMDKLFPDRGEGTSFRDFERAYDPDTPGMDDPKKQKAYIDRLRANQIQSPHKGNLKDNLDVKTALAVGAGKRKKEETPYEGPFGKLGEYFSKNADAREKLFAYIGEMGKELVKPIEPGQAAAGDLVPTLSRGLDKGEKKYEEARAAEAKMMKDLAQAQKDANPLQFYTNKMKEARYMAWNNGIDPDSAEGTSWIGNWLQTQGVASGAADLSAAIKSMSEAIMQETDPDKKKDLEKQRDRLNEQLTAIVMQGSGGGYSEEVIDYDIYKQG